MTVAAAVWPASQIAALNKPIQVVLTQVKQLVDNKELTDEQKSEMQQIYQSHITMLQAQIVQLAQQQTEQDQPKKVTARPSVRTK